MSYPINYPTPQGANIQIFSQQLAGSSFNAFSWVKPQGVSFVWFTLIGGGGGGGGGDGSTLAGGGGGSGSVTNCLVPAFLIPDVLMVSVGNGGVPGTSATGFDGGNGGDSYVRYRAKDTTTYALLAANGGTGGSASAGTGGTGGVATTSNYFSAAGFFQSIAGQDGANPGLSVNASTTTFLAGGAGGAGTNNSNYGYTTTGQGFFQLNPIIVGSGGRGNNNVGGVGCGGGGTPSVGTSANGGRGGSGLVVIISW